MKLILNIYDHCAVMQDKFHEGVIFYEGVIEL